jgi:hypothetical protein
LTAVVLRAIGTALGADYPTNALGTYRISIWIVIRANVAFTSAKYIAHVHKRSVSVWDMIAIKVAAYQFSGSVCVSILLNPLSSKLEAA